MRAAGLSNFRKLFGRIDQQLNNGTYIVNVTTNSFGRKLYDVSTFNGTKSFVLSTTTAMGGRNYFLAICYIVVGALCLVIAIIFFGAYMQNRSQIIATHPAKL